MSDETTMLQAIMDEFEHECFMLRVEASETRARDDVVRKSYERIRDEFAGRIAALVSDRESELQSALNKAAGNWAKADALLRERMRGTLTAEQVREAVEASTWAETSTIREFNDSSWQEIADELNARYHCGLTDEDYNILLDELGVSEMTCSLIEDGDSLHCSNCGGAAEKQSWVYWSYCPNCRARVVGE